MTSVRKTKDSAALTLLEVRQRHGDNIGPTFVAIDFVESLGISMPIIAAQLANFVAHAWEEHPSLTCRQMTDLLLRQHGVNLFTLARESW